MARFAELLAATAGTPDDGNVAVCAERMGYGRAYGNAMLQRLRRDLGAQAREECTKCGHRDPWACGCWVKGAIK